MFGIDSSELLLIAVVALVVIGPKDLPRVMRMVGGWVGRGRAMTRHLRAGFDTMMREAELDEMQKQWAAQNADIMAATTPAWTPPAPGAEPVMTGPQPASLDEPVSPQVVPQPAVVSPGPPHAPSADLAG
ncbi:MAG: Sec-independent protein translocase protein TatB [Janthinobacterium lividum]